jgi:hypothetical protein
VDKTLFIQSKDQHNLIVQIYVDDIIFGATLDSLAHDFADSMKQEFEMSMIGELNFFWGFKLSKVVKLSSSLKPSMPRTW